MPFFPSIHNGVNYYPSKTNNDATYGWMHVQKKVKCMLKESNTWVQEVGIENCWYTKY